MAFVSAGGVVGCGLLLCVVLTLAVTRAGFLGESGLVGAGGLAGLPVLEAPSDHGREKEEDEKTI